MIKTIKKRIDLFITQLKNTLKGAAITYKDTLVLIVLWSPLLYVLTEHVRTERIVDMFLKWLDWPNYYALKMEGVRDLTRKLLFMILIILLNLNKEKYRGLLVYIKKNPTIRVLISLTALLGVIVILL